MSNQHRKPKPSRVLVDLPPSHANKVTRRMKEAVKNRDGNKCLMCHTTKNLTVDHVIPKLMGGIDSVANLQTLCRHHNKTKGSHHCTDYRDNKEAIALDPYLNGN